MSVDFTGTWKNQHGSTLELREMGGALSGRFESGVGDDGQALWVDVSGRALGDVITFSAVYTDYGIIVAWVGQHTVEDGVGTIKTHWIHATNLPDPQAKDWMWFSNRIGSDIFSRL
jgi:hypothetical protein